MQLRKQNTAIKEGFQSVIDYWPDSPQAIAAAYYIGRTYKDIGRVKEAKVALKDVVAKHPQHLVAVYALNDLIDITDDRKRRAGPRRAVEEARVRHQAQPRLAAASASKPRSIWRRIRSAKGPLTKA